MSSPFHALREWLTLEDLRSKAEAGTPKLRTLAQNAIDLALAKTDAADALLRASLLEEASRLSMEAGALTEEAAASVIRFERSARDADDVSDDVIDGMALKALNVPAPLRRAIDTLTTADSPTRGQIADGLGALYRVLARLGRAIDPPDVLRFVALRRQLGVVALIAAPLVVLAYQASTKEEPLYLAEYYSNERLDGTVEIDEVAQVDFEWEHGAPLRSVTADHFSARWTTCLHVEAAQEFGLSLGIDDGARAFIETDGERTTILNDWEAGGVRWVSRSAPIGPGTHKLIIEYFERGGQATARAVLRSNSGAFEGTLSMPNSNGECE